MPARPLLRPCGTSFKSQASRVRTGRPASEPARVELQGVQRQGDGGPLPGRGQVDGRGDAQCRRGSSQGSFRGTREAGLSSSRGWVGPVPGPVGWARPPSPVPRPPSQAPWGQGRERWKADLSVTGPRGGFTRPRKGNFAARSRSPGLRGHPEWWDPVGGTSAGPPTLSGRTSNPRP